MGHSHPLASGTGPKEPAEVQTKHQDEEQNNVTEHSIVVQARQAVLSM